jgi:hypothetical protein
MQEQLCGRSDIEDRRPRVRPSRDARVNGVRPPTQMVLPDSALPGKATVTDAAWIALAAVARRGDWGVSA